MFGPAATDRPLDQVLRIGHIAGETGSFESAPRGRRGAGGRLESIELAIVEPTASDPFGPVASVDAADRLLARLLANGHSGARIVVD